MAPPICCEVLIRPEASPASRSATPASAAIETGTNANAMPTPTITYPGNRSLANFPCTGICEYQIIAPVSRASPITMIGFAPNLVVSAWATPAARTAVPAVAMKVNPVFSGE